MDVQALTTRIDEALERYSARELVHASEVVDVLLDLRLVLLAAEADEAREAAGSPN